MKLIKRIERQEGRAREIAHIGLIWTNREVLLDPARGGGGRIVSDLWEVLDELGPGADDVRGPEDVDAPAVPDTDFMRSVEREAEDECDEGRVYSAAGELVGLVLMRQGSLLTIEYFPHPDRPVRLLTAGTG